jgi:hypothetical protein
MTAEIEFNQNDFFYNNINTPLKFDNSLCSLSDISLNIEIARALNLPADISYGADPDSDQKPGQCGWRKVQPGDTVSATSWKMEYSKDKLGNLSCKCVELPEDNDKNTIISWNNSGGNLASLTGSTYAEDIIDKDTKYTCAPSLPIAFENQNLSNVTVDISAQRKLIDSTVKYYKSACKNYNKSNKLINEYSSKENNELKYDDTKSYYNREYLNRINLGLGILATCGIIYFTLSSSNVAIQKVIEPVKI